MKMMKTLLVLGSVTALLACGVDQDPFKDRSEAIRNGQPPEEKPAPPASVPADAMKIDTEDAYSIKEGSTLKINLAGRVLLPAVKFAIGVANLEQFPGATFDPATGDFQWKPAVGSVSDDVFDIVKLKLIMVTEPNAAYPVSMSKGKEVELRVYRNYGQPEIFNVSNPGASREGELKNFEVTLRDVDALTKDDVALMVTSPDTAVVNLASRIYVSSYTQDSTDKSVWKVRMGMDLRRVEITDRSLRVPVEVQARSRFGKLSAVQTVTFEILTSLEKPISTWMDSFYMVAGEKNKVSFTVYDPKYEGEIQLTWLDDISKMLPGSVMSCVASGVATQVCNLSVQPPAEAVGNYTLRLSAFNKSRAIGDSYSTSQNFNYRLVVTAPPTTTTTTTTTTTSTTTTTTLERR